MTGVTFPCVAPPDPDRFDARVRGLVHEDRPRDGAPTIAFRRVGLEPMDYELRVVNVENDATHPFTLTLTTWQ